MVTYTKAPKKSTGRRKIDGNKPAYESPYKVIRSVETRNIKIKTESCLTHAGGEKVGNRENKNEKLK
jgi:hypothetical protein